MSENNKTLTTDPELVRVGRQVQRERMASESNFSQLIADKMRQQRPTLREYLRSRAAGEAKSHKEWEEAFPGCGQAAYRAGSSNAYLDIEQKLIHGEFKPESEKAET